MSMNNTDLSLVMAAKNGNDPSFEELYKHYYQKVYALALTTLQNVSVAEDVLQSSFIEAWQKLGTLSDPSAFEVMLYQITLKRCAEFAPNRDDILGGPVIPSAEPWENEWMLPKAYAERAELGERLDGAVARLGVLSRQSLMLCSFCGLSVSEAARVLRCDDSTIFQRLNAARVGVIRQLEQQERQFGEHYIDDDYQDMLPFESVYREQVLRDRISGSQAKAFFINIYAGYCDSPNPAEAENEPKKRMTPMQKALIAVIAAVLLLLGIVAAVALPRIIKGGDKPEPKPIATSSAPTVAPTRQNEPETEALTAEPAETEPPATEQPTTAEPETEEPTTAEPDASEIFDEIPGNYILSSGVGLWRSTLTVNSDGSFSGYHSDVNMGDNGYLYPKGSVILSNYTGKFIDVKKVDDHTYTCTASGITYQNTPGTEEIKDGRRCSYIEADGVSEGSEMTIYTSGTPVSSLNSELLSWPPVMQLTEGDTLSGCIIVCTNGQYVRPYASNKS